MHRYGCVGCGLGPLSGAAALGLALASASASAAPGEFLEPEVQVLHQFEGDQGGGSFGWAVSELGDIDGDGAMEAMAGAPGNSIGGMGAGRSYAFSGKTGALLYTFTGDPGDKLGYALADAGDVDGDGTTDIIVGAPGNGPGHARVYSGADGLEIAVLAGDTMAGRFGVAVASAGDLDDDGHADVLVGAEKDLSGGVDAGRVYAISGADQSTLWTRDGAAGNLLGSGTAPLGDINGDDVPDVVVGAPGQGGAVWVLSGVDGADIYPPLVGDPGSANLGNFFVGGLADVNDDDVPDIYGGDYGADGVGPGAGKAYVWSGKTGARLFTFAGEFAGDGAGPGRAGGDANGDGVPDIAVGFYSATRGDVQGAGLITLYSGTDGSTLRTITGTTANEQIGFDVVTIGDVNDDGRDDLVLSGAADNRVYIVAGVLGGETTDTDGSDTDGSDTDATTDATTDGSDTDATTTDATTTDATTDATGDPTSSSDGGSDSMASDASSETDAGSSDGGTTAGSSGGEDSGESSGCGCAAQRPAPATALIALVIAGVLRPRRRR